tara:strand:- start:1786 stop:2292 length:507 start_codon:yes stop_codon:yes gene_type:complete
MEELEYPGESAPMIAKRLSEEKAYEVALRKPDSLIIASDQVPCLNGELLKKPGNHQTAVEQLQKCSGQTVNIYTGLCLLDSADPGNFKSLVEQFDVKFRILSKKQIENYLRRDKPYDCAGSFKAEGLGISLFQSLTGGDPNTLIGLPLIALIELLQKQGVDILASEMI